MEILYKTEDGTIFKTRQKAEKHEAKLARERLMRDFGFTTTKELLDAVKARRGNSLIAFILQRPLSSWDRNIFENVLPKYLSRDAQDVDMVVQFHAQYPRRLGSVRNVPLSVAREWSKELADMLGLDFDEYSLSLFDVDVKNRRVIVFLTSRTFPNLDAYLEDRIDNHGGEVSEDHLVDIMSTWQKRVSVDGGMKTTIKVRDKLYVARRSACEAVVRLREIKPVEKTVIDYQYV